LARGSTPCGAIEKTLQTSRLELPAAAAPGIAALGLRFEKNLISNISKKSKNAAIQWIIS